MVRPREIRAMKPATNGEKAMTQHQMNTVHQPFQLSCQLSSVVAASPESVHMLMSTKFAMKLPKVWDMFEMMNSVGPKISTAPTSTMLRIEFTLLIRAMPLLMPTMAEIEVMPAK